MKASNALGKTNFYTTDAKLVEVTTAIRNTTMVSGDPAENIKTKFCVVLDDSDPTNIQYDEDHYDISKIASLVDISGYTLSTSNNKIEHFDHPTESDTTRYIFHDIEVKHTSTGGFENNVKTDLILDVYEKTVPGGNGGGGVGNMSMLLDAPLSTESATFKNLTMTGNAFIADYVKNAGVVQTVLWDDGKYYVKAGSGLTMTNEARLNLAGSNNVIYGDLSLSGGASLVVYGNLTVFGDISVTGGSTLILCDDANLFQMKEKNVPGKDHISTFSAGSSNVYPSDLSSNIKEVSAEQFAKFANSVNIQFDSSATPSDYGLITNIFAKNPADKNGNHPLGNIRLIDADPGTGAIEIYDVTGLTKSQRDRGYKISSSVFSYDDFGFGFIENTGSDIDNVNGYQYSNRLMISFNSGKISLLQSSANTTWISKAPVTCDLQHCVTLSKIGTAQFNYMTAGKGDDESECYDTKSNPFNNVNFTLNKFDSSKKFVGKFGSFFEEECNNTVDNMFGYATDGGSGSDSKSYASAVTFDSYARDYK